MCGCHGDEWCWRRRGSVAFLPLVSLWSSSLHPHSGGTSVSVVSKEAAAADKQLLCSLMGSLWRQHDCGAKWQTSLRLSSYRSRPLVFVERFIPSHASKNTHKHTHTQKQHQGGKVTLGPGDSHLCRKHLQGCEVRRRTLGIHGITSPGKQCKCSCYQTLHSHTTWMRKHIQRD